MNDSRFLAWERAEQRWESLLEAVESQIPADFVPLDDATRPREHRRAAELEITITERKLGTPGESASDSDPLLVSHVTVRIRPEAPRTHQARLRHWTELCRLRDSIRHQLANLRRGIQGRPPYALQESLDNSQTEPGLQKGGKAGVRSAEADQAVISARHRGVTAVPTSLPDNT